MYILLALGKSVDTTLSRMGLLLIGMIGYSINFKGLVLIYLAPYAQGTYT